MNPFLYEIEVDYRLSELRAEAEKERRAQLVPKSARPSLIESVRELFGRVHGIGAPTAGSRPVGSIGPTAA
jgi:hypothetical protein